MNDSTTKERKDTLLHPNPCKCHPSSLLERKKPKRYDHARLSLPKRVDHQKWISPSLVADLNELKSKEPNISQNWTSDGDTTMYELRREMNGKQPSSQTEDYSNQKSCSSAYATHLQPSKQ